MLAGTIGSRPVGSDANRRARAYLIDQLRLYGFEVRVQQADAPRPEFGQTARVSNIIAVKPGARADALALVAHYDSSLDAPGAADDGLGTAVCLEAGRLLSARSRPNYSLMILLTDGEEAGLMGAAALVTDRDVTSRLRAYINVESIGSSGPTVLFETGPGDAWLVAAWASEAPRPRGSSYATEIYKRLPNDTDFTILRRLGVPGLNFAAIGDSYAYHTARDTPDRLAGGTIRQTGDNVLALAEALDRWDLSAHSPGDPVYFDLAGIRGLSYGPAFGHAIAIASLLAGVVALFRLVRDAHRILGLGALLITSLWTILGFLAVVAALAAAAWAARSVREAYHPWYAHPDRFFALIALAGISTGWAVVRLATRLPARMRAVAEPVLVWCVTLPVWIVLAAAIEWLAPAASYLWTLPLLAAGIFLSGTPAASPPAMRVSSLLAFASVATLWGRDLWELLHFTVAQMGRLPIVTPVLVYPVLMMCGGVMLVPPFLAIVAQRTPRLTRPALVSATLLALLAIAAGLVYAAPAYTHERPLRRQARFVQDATLARARWEIGGTEPGLDLNITPGAPSDWRPMAQAPAWSVPIGRFQQPFMFEAPGIPVVFPGAITATIRAEGEAIELDIAVTAPESSVVSFAMPPGLRPRTPNLPGTLVSNRWIADYVAPPPEGIAFRGSFSPSARDRLSGASVVIWTSRLPGGSGWQSLPDWMPQDRTVWQARAIFIEPIGPRLSDRPVTSAPGR